MLIHFSQATHLQKFGNFRNSFRKRFRTVGEVAAVPPPTTESRWTTRPPLFSPYIARGAVVPRETPMRYPAPASPLPDSPAGAQRLLPRPAKIEKHSNVRHTDNVLDEKPVNCA